MILSCVNQMQDAFHLLHGLLRSNFFIIKSSPRNWHVSDPDSVAIEKQH